MTTDERILVLMPTAKDGERMGRELGEAGLGCAVCKDVADLCREIRLGAGAAMLTEEAVVGDRDGCLFEELRDQPPWSDFPLVVLAREGSEGHLIRESMNATLVERPVKVRSLLSVVRAALRSRRRQYEVRDHLAERERQAVALKESEEHARQLLEFHQAVTLNMGEGLYAVDTQGQVTYLNPAAETLFGWTRDELLGRKMHDVTHYKHPDGTPFPAEECPGLRVLRQGTPLRDYDDVFIRKDGAFFPVVYSSSPLVAEGRNVGLVVVFRDVTEQKRAEEALARVTEESDRRKRLFETALSNTPDLIFVFGLDHRFTYANEALLTMWGRTWEEAIGKNCLELGYEPWQAARHDREVDQVIATRRPIHGEAPFTGTHGRRVYDYIFAPVFGAGGEVEAVAGTARDTTDRKAMEEELRDTDRKKDDFIALLAHELRNPLAPIRNGLQILRLAGGDVDAVGQARAMMDRQLTNMVRLIDDLLDVSRISRNKMELRCERVLLGDVVGSAVETARPLIDAAGHDLSLSMPPGPVFLDADLTRLAQVFSNLLTNSAKYTGRGGKIRLAAERRGGEVVVTVRDNGIGIPAASLGNIFDMFSQVDRSVERNTGGLGIGLALVKGLVEMHGGTVTAASDGEGRGSAFTVRLPVVEGRPAPQPGVADNGQHGPGRRVLVVDDNRDGAASMAMMLRLMGDEVRAAHDGVEAVAVAEQFRPEVILMDVGMPRLNGLDATRRIREQPWGRTLTIIALTGWGQVGDKERSREAGCDGHLVKPVNLQDLEKLLGEVGNGVQPK